MRTAARMILGTLVVSSVAAGTRAQAQPYVHGGGEVVTSPEVVVVYWGTQRAGLQAQLDAFYGRIAASNYFDVLSDYGAGGSVRLAGSVQILPGDSGPVDTVRIARELDRQILSGALPSPGPSTIYMVHFGEMNSVVMGTNIAGVPIGVAAGGFCAYHFTAQVRVPFLPPIYFYGPKIRIGVIPDPAPGLCPGNGTGLDFSTAAATHELVEAITNPDAVVVQMFPSAGETLQCNGIPIPPEFVNAYDLWAWTSARGSPPCDPQEVADTCGSVPFTAAGTSYAVSAVWRNSTGACSVAAPLPPRPATLTATVTPYPVPIGVSVSVRVDVLDPSGNQVPGMRIYIDGRDVAAAGQPFTYTFRLRRVGKPPDVQLVLPTGQASNGQRSLPLDFGF